MRAALAFFVSLLVAGQPVLACECEWFQKQGDRIVRLETPPPLERSEVEGYSAIFAGRVVALQLALVGSVEEVQASVMVVQRWKGQGIPEKARVATAAYVTACGYSFALGETYVFYVKEDAKAHEMRVGSCSRTKPVSGAADEIRVLEELLGKPSAK